MHLPETEPPRHKVFPRVSPGPALAAAVAIITVTALLPRRPDPLYIIPTAILCVAWILCRMPLGSTLRRLMVAQFFILSIALLSLMRPAALPIFLSAVLKSNLCILTLLLLTWTIPFHDLLRVLRRLHFPPVMLTTLTLMYRYLPVLAEESRRMQRARASRTFLLRRRIAWHSLTIIIGRLFIRSAERAERIYLAMCARGWK